MKSIPVAHRNCILPPYVLENIIERGSSRQRARAQVSLNVSQQFRAGRQETPAPRVPRAPGVLSIEKSRTVYDAENGSNLPGREVRTEGEGPSGDAAVDEAFDGSGAMYDLFSEVYGRNSIDNNGMALISSVHYQTGYDNAFWTGSQMVYGDGDEDLPEDERLFNRFTIALDVIGHELTHGVTQYEAGFIYMNQPGALNESMSDVFGSLVKQKLRGQTAQQADWIIGEGLFTSAVNGVGIRSMKAPGTAYDDPVLGKDPQPAHMDDYKNVTYDNGGVHINSGIPNHAFYVAAMELGGYAWEKAGQIWYAALTQKLGRASDFQQAANLTYQAAGEIYGQGSLEQQAVKNGWQAVGLNVEESGGGGTGSGCLAAPAAFFKTLFSQTRNK